MLGIGWKVSEVREEEEEEGGRVLFKRCCVPVCSQLLTKTGVLAL